MSLFNMANGCGGLRGLKDWDFWVITRTFYTSAAYHAQEHSEIWVLTS